MTITASVVDYVINSLWMVPLVFVLASPTARALRRISPETEHRVWVTALILQVLLPAVSKENAIFRPVLSTLLGVFSHSPAATEEGLVAVKISQTLSTGTIGLPIWLQTAIAFALVCSISIFLCRLVVRVRRSVSLRFGAQHPSLPSEAAEVLHRVRHQFGVREVTLLESACVSGPSTQGIFRPVLIVPSGFLITAAREDLQAAFAHELAHISRKDYAKNLCYEFLSLPIAFHPMFWRTRARLCETREIVCDALAANVVQGRTSYARSLLRLAEQCLASPHSGRTQLIGVFDGCEFERRITMLTAKQWTTKPMQRICLLAAAACVALLACGTALAMHVTVPSSAAKAITMQSGGVDAPAQVSSGVIASMKLTGPNPVYPDLARAAHISGSVVLAAVIGTDGTMQKLQVISGPPELSGAALDAVRQWTYKPYLLNGQPVEVQTTITVNFQLGE